ncbi:YdhK family protein [Lysinibacillus cavernae]|uniref:YdhK family protein n=1 Tax=Lysinibacillus cavernae TaxID=2666135 RepID=UPI0012D9F00F|nr:YdhK family protein [Lysinibacillus cavernae]
MTFKRKWSIGLLSAAALISLSACTEDKTGTNNSAGTEQQAEMDHSTMNHSSSGEVPSTLKNAENPKFPVGSTAIITDGHMDGMKGAEATIVGAYNTTAYMISYEPTLGGKRVENHKWVIHEELIDPDGAPLAPGTEVKTDAAHMEGMENATVRIDEAVKTTVYMVDYTSTTNGEAVKNHKWVTEAELSTK